MKRGQIHNKIAQVLKCGKPVTVEEIKSVFAGTKIEPVLYRLSTQIWNIKKEGGIIKPHKSGRKVLAYQLMNPESFDDRGLPIQT